MSYLLIDVGNTKAKYCLMENNRYQLLSYEEALDSLNKVDGIVIAEVANNEEVLNIRSKAKSLSLNVVVAEVTPESFGVVCGYPKYRNLGIDRWLAVLAAEELYPNENLLIVDAGTALTIDFLTAEKRHLGGWIIPGLDLMKSSIVSKAPGVFAGTSNVKDIFGMDTPSALNNGCISACIGTLKQAENYLSEFVQDDVKIIITGGNGSQISEQLTDENDFVEFLVFIGLARFIDQRLT